MTKACQGRVGVGEGERLTFRHDALDKCGTSRPAIDLPSQLGIERDGQIQQ
jgi:hypothetical protein